MDFEARGFSAVNGRVKEMPVAFERLEKYRETIWNDQACGVCHRGPWNPYRPFGPTSDRLCPEYEKFRTITHTAQGRIQAARWLLEGKLRVSEDFVKVTYDCLLCGACSTVGCVVDKDHVPIFRELRADLVAMGMGPPAPFRKTAALIEKAGNRFGRPQGERAGWAEDMNTPSKADLVYFAGCVASYRTPELARAAAAVLSRAQVPFAILGSEEWCCGQPLASSGQMEVFASVARHNVEAFQKAGASRVVTACGCCYSVLKFDYPRVLGRLDFEVLHITQILAELIGKGKLRPEKPFSHRVTYQDPCHLVRLGGKIVSEPRSILKSIPGVELVEMEGNGRDTQCCGRFPMELPELSLHAGINRIRDAETVGADAIVTACSFCHWNLKRAGKNVGSGMQIMDIAELVRQGLEG